MADWGKLSASSKLLYIITMAQRMRCLELVEKTTRDKKTWDHAWSLLLAHWNLAADLARLLENEMKEQLRSRGLAPSGTLGEVINQYCGRTLHGGTHPGLPTPSAWAVHYVSVTWPGVSDTTGFNVAFPGLKQAIEDKATAPEVRIANAIRLLNAARNQVAHKVDENMILFTEPTAARFTVDVLLSLCHVEGWTP